MKMKEDEKLTFEVFLVFQLSENANTRTLDP